jgi:hypothetical protein
MMAVSMTVRVAMSVAVGRGMGVWFRCGVPVFLLVLVTLGHARSLTCRATS